MVDRAGIPLAAGLTGAERPDQTVFEALIDTIPAVRQPGGRRRKRPAKLHADKGDDVRRCRRFLARRGIACRIARKGVEDKARPGRHRWVVERTFAWLGQNWRFSKDFERLTSAGEALIYIAMTRLLVRRLART